MRRTPAIIPITITSIPRSPILLVDPDKCAILLFIFILLDSWRTKWTFNNNIDNFRFLNKDTSRRSACRDWSISWRGGWCHNRTAYFVSRHSIALTNYDWIWT